jgi:tubulin-specific chaperone C
MHDSRNTSVYLSCSSRPIIENSSEIRFSEYPAIFGKRAGITSPEKEDWLVKELVEDFNWLRREHSPNWRVIQDGIGNDTWTEIIELVDQDSPLAERVLQLVV